MRKKDDLDIAMDHYSSLQRRRHRLARRGDDVRAQAELDQLDAELARLRPVRDAYVGRKFFRE